MHNSNVSRRGFINTVGMIAAAGSGQSMVHAEQSDNNPKANDCFARDVKDLGHVDVLVCGGGPSGVAAAVQAARAGAKVLLIERYGRLGGMATLAMVHPLMGHVKSPFVDEILKNLGGRGVNFELIDLRYADMLRQAGADILLHSWVCETIVDNEEVLGVRFFCKQGVMQVTADVTIDATGDGDVSIFAGAEYEQGRPEDGLVQPVSIMYRVSGVDETGLICGGEKQALKTKVGSKTWAQIVKEGQDKGELPSTISVIRTYACPRKTDRGINATQVNGVDGTKVRDLTRAEIEGRQQAQQVLRFLQKYAPGYEKAYISAMPSIIGVRETRRVLGVEYLTRDDVVTGRKRDDAVVCQASFPIDIHNPSGGGQAEGIAADVKPYDIPYGCLVPKKIDNLLVAGRCISGSHDAHASYRVQCIAMALGSAAGAAAALAIKSKISPRQIMPGDIRKIIGLETE